MNSVKQIYEGRHQQFEADYKQSKRQLNIIVFTRLGLFLLAAGLLIVMLTYGYTTTLWWGILLAIVVLFLLLVKKHQALKYQTSFLEQLMKINEEEIRVLSGDFRHFSSGKAHLDIELAYLYDLDILGDGSIFQYLNRTCTWNGEIELASYFKNPLMDKAQILERQVAIHELKDLVDWRQDFQASGRISELNADGWKEVNYWLKLPTYLLKHRFLSIAVILLPLILVALFVAYMLGFVPSIFPILAGIINLLLTGVFLKTINALHGQVSKKYPIIRKYGDLIEFIEKQSFQSPLLIRLKDQLKQDGKTASHHIRRLSQMISALDNRQNPLLGILLNACLLWDIRYTLQLENWKEQFKDEIPKWLNSMQQFDALSSLANMHFNRPDFIFPEIEMEGYCFDAQKIGHPLLDENKRVDNDFELNNWGSLALITGANMAGKSTFLRAVGVNYLLGMIGSVVCAKQFKITPAPIESSMRTTDSLLQDESYFYAELKRLQGIIQHLEAGRPAFVILDEMLKGTNSKDKHSGSESLLRKLTKLPCAGMVATHDLAISNLENEYPENIKNYSFEVEIQNDELKFDYKIRRGVCQTLNATFLMKKMGIIE